MLTGQCHCGAIRYEVSGAISSQTICHCSICRATTGAPCVAWFTVPLTGFRLTAGTPVTYRSSGHGTRTFCGACGAQLTFSDDDYPDAIDVTTCTLAQPQLAAPTSHIFMDSAVPWMVPGDGLPRYRCSRSEGGLAD